MKPLAHSKSNLIKRDKAVELSFVCMEKRGPIINFRLTFITYHNQEHGLRNILRKGAYTLGLLMP